MGKAVETDDDVLRAAENLAADGQTTAGRVVSDLARQTLARRIDVDRLPVRDGFPYLPKRGGVVTPDLIKQLTEDEL